MRGMFVRLGVSTGLLVCLAAPAFLRADEGTEVYPLSNLGLGGESPQSMVDKAAGNDMLPYTADDVAVGADVNPGGGWGSYHFDVDSNNKVDAGEHFLLTPRVGDAAIDAEIYSALSRPEYGVIYEAEDWRVVWDASQDPGTRGDRGDGDFELNDNNGWCGESNAYVYNNLGANQHGLGLPKYRVDYHSAATAGQSFTYDEITGFVKTVTFRNTFDDPDTAFNEKGDCTRWLIAKEEVDLRGYLIPVDDLPTLADGSLPSLFGWETVDLAKYLRETIAPKLTHPDLTTPNDFGLDPTLPPTHLFLAQMEVPFEVSNANGECGGTGLDPCATEENPALCQVQSYASYWGMTPTGGVSTFRMSELLSLRDDSADLLFGVDAPHKWQNLPEDGSRRNLWLQDHFWRDDSNHLGKYTFEPSTTTWTIIEQPNFDLLFYDKTKDAVIVSNEAGSISGPLPKPLGLGETAIEAVVDLAVDVTPPPEPAGAGAAVGSFQVILRNDNKVIAYADISNAATKVHLGGTYDAVTGLASVPAQSSAAGAGATIEEISADPEGPFADYTRFVLRVTSSGVSLRQAKRATYTTNDFLDLDTLGTEMVALSAPAESTFASQGGVNTVTVGSDTRAAINTLMVFASPGTGPFIRGEANGDGKVDLSDGVSILNFLFTGGATPKCMAAADGNGDGKVDLSDGVFVLNFLFTGGAAPIAPFPSAAFSQSGKDALIGCLTPQG